MELSGYVIDHNCVFSVVSQIKRILAMLTVNGSVSADVMACILIAHQWLSMCALFSTNDGDLLWLLHNGLQKITLRWNDKFNCGFITGISL